MSARKLRWRKDGAKDIPVEDACWQYLLDHARILKNGRYFIQIDVENKENFLSSLEARKKGKYRNSEDDLAPSH